MPRRARGVRAAVGNMCRRAGAEQRSPRRLTPGPRGRPARATSCGMAILAMTGHGQDPDSSGRAARATLHWSEQSPTRPVPPPKRFGTQESEGGNR
jgi:hypothetical protein